MKFFDHLLSDKNTIKEALNKINNIGLRSNVLFVIGDDGDLRGSVSDGDIRRALLRDVSINNNISKAMNESCKYLVEGEITNELLRRFREKGISLIPLIDDSRKVISILDLQKIESIVPVETVIMAGGKGKRMLPLTLDTPKPLLKVGDKPIIEHTIDRLTKYGINKIHISINYLGEKIQDYFKDGSPKGIKINYLQENKPLGTIGALTLLEDLQHDAVLLMNSDLLTNINFGNLYDEFVKYDADLAVASVPYHVDLPYAVMELEDNAIKSLREKPRYTYFANAGIYLIKKELLTHIPKNSFYDSTDLIERAIADGKKVINFPILGYWLDIGQMRDYQKAQEDIKHLVL